jgi:hypothetical protein
LPEISADTVPPAIETPVPKLSAQQIKDQAAQMVATDRAQAVELFRQAEAMGHKGAGIDLAFMEYHGFGGMVKDPSHAIGKMQDVLENMAEAGKANTAEFRRGQNLLADWTGFKSPVTMDTAKLIADAGSVTEDALNQEIASQIPTLPEYIHPAPLPTLTPM